MSSPTLAQLPPPPPGKTGWPWTEASPPLAETLPNGQPWPKITLVTPSYNQGQFVEETIRSVLLQGYPNLEYLVIDGGSGDNSVDIIQKYAPWLTWWVSEPDRGQSHAINKGFALATGQLIGWENSDDLLMPNALAVLAQAHMQNPDTILLGNVINFDQTGELELYRQRDVTLRNLVEFWAQRHRWHMPGIFYPRALLNQVGLLDESLRYVFDADLLCRLLQIAPTVYLPQPVARFRYHADSKTVSEIDRFMAECLTVSQRYRSGLGQIDERGLKPYQAERLALVGAQAIWRGQTKFGLGQLAQSVRLSPMGVVNYVAHASARRWRKYAHRWGWA